MRHLGPVALLLVLGGFLILGWLADGDPLGRWLLGLPAPLGVMVWGMACGILVALGLLYARAFPSWRPGAEELDELRDLARLDVAPRELPPHNRPPHNRRPRSRTDG